MSTCGDRLKEERQRLGLNQTEFGAIAGVQKQAQLKYEKGERSPDADYLAAVARAGADVQYIVTGARSGTVPALDTAERLLLENYRRCPPDAQANLLQNSALLAAGLTGSATNTSAKQVIRGQVGQAIKVEGDLDQSGISFFGGKKGRK